jgi:hypothetical protein
MSHMMPYPLADHIRVYRDGRIESFLKPGRIGGKGTEWHRLAVQGPKRGGCPHVYIKMRGRYRAVAVHLVVLYAWHGPPEPGQIARHLDGDRLNYHLDNLAWGTHKEVMRDAIRNGRIRSGERHGNAKVSDHQREMIRAAALTGLGIAHLAREFGITYAAAHYIAYGRPSRGGHLRTEQAAQRSDWTPTWDRPPVSKRMRRKPPELLRPPTEEERQAYRLARPGRGRKKSAA